LDGEPHSKTKEKKGDNIIYFRADNDTKKHSFFINVTQEFQFNGSIGINYYLTPGGVPYNKFATLPSQTIIGNIKISNNMPSLKLKDFFGSLINQFNLIIVPTSANDYYIDTLDSWYNKGETFDITKLVSIDDITIKKPDIKKLIEFKYQEAGLKSVNLILLVASIISVSELSP